MQYRRLGNSDLNVSEISLGSWLTYGGGVERQQAEACIHKAFDVGINFIDTANVYGRGAAESFLGEVLQGIDRKSYVLATKVYFPMSPTDQGLSGAQIHKQIDASLQRLRTDYVDLYQCHRYDANTPLEETMEALTNVVRQGKARYIGFSEWNPSQIQAALNMNNVERFVSSQPQYSMLWRKPEAEVFPLCAANGIGQIVWSPLAQGVLTGKYKPGEVPPQDSRAANSQMNAFMGDITSERVLSAVQSLKPIAQGLNISMAQLALAWVLRDSRVSCAIIGASRPEQVADNAVASGVKLNDDVLRKIDEVLAPALLHATAA
ncbi:aldo/keto reductase [Dulcicalothrix desertica PCC 7102]|uniref:Aldo/keto reductase n=1 Tax=Dulcicalothrix desertica PCC 7102 TaxID=232991 RepID=A0A433VJC5_9CYAN|nr:aldo/keto reductase family protein [Dulcicalothrix desertica]RUT06197.1 aldo/keto reductase [Dulcicalothrix desertica PCC 7102]TWH54141.1 aryl-alcohol dehydrogenase-like predicted oxidoreductase [Dulcicalothrix desertica PCC 7102]